MKTKNKLYLATLSLLISNALMAQEVPINDVLPVLATKSVTEQPSNVWFILDDSGSMQRGIGYNPNTTYEIPLDIEGNPFPLPPKGRSFINHYVRIGNRNIYEDPFINYVNNGGVVSNHRTYTEPTQCMRSNTQAARTNCRIWASYYRSRSSTLKSAFSLAINEVGRDKNFVRWGFDTLWRNNGVTRQVMPRDITTSRTALYNSVFMMFPSGGTPLRSRFAQLIVDAASNSRTTPSANSEHPDLYDLNEPYNKDKNPILACRRNHMLLLTDGGWNSDRSQNIRNYLSSNGFPANGAGYLRSNSLTLPDGMVFRDTYPPYGITDQNNNILTIGDIAFAAWSNDLNNNSSDDNLVMIRPRLPNASGDGVFYSNSNVTGSGNIPSDLVTLSEEEITEGHYWHPYNDPASWQHINTHTIAFGLGNQNLPDINPPKTQAEAQQKASYPFDVSNYINETQTLILPNRDGGTNDSNRTIQGLARGALAGRGQFHSVVTPQGLVAAFDSIFSAINDSNQLGASINRGSAAAIASASSSGSKQLLLSAQFNPKTFAGEVLAFEIFDGTQDADECWKEPERSNYADSNGKVYPWVSLGTFCNNEDGVGAWKASDSINGLNYASRNVYTSVLKKIDGDEIEDLSDLEEKVAEGKRLKLKPAEFEFANLKDYRKSTSQGQLSEDAVKYIRGDASNEVRNGGGFRDRVEKEDSSNGWILGDLGRSAPVFVGARPAFPSDHIALEDKSSRNDFDKFRNQARTDMVYFGSNDGMLHALDASTSRTKRVDREQFAYVPHALYDKLPLITDETSHYSFVDGKITVETVYKNKGHSEGDWHLRLVSGLGGGGKGLFSLDVTNNMVSTSDFKKASPWEYSEKDSQSYNANKNKPGKSNIGNILSVPGVVQVKNTSDKNDSGWIVAVGNGYNAESNKAALIILDLFTGKVLQELVLDTSKNEKQHQHYVDNSKTNGLGPLLFVSYEGKNSAEKYQTDRAYAGDLQGNLWVFDFSHFDITKCRKAKKKSDKLNYCASVASSQFNKKNIIPLFTAIDPKGNRQPITVAPQVEEHPLGFGYLLHFGTGALFDRNDLSASVTNSIYAIWDDWVPFGLGNGSGLATPKTDPIAFDRNKKSHLRKLSWTRSTMNNSNGHNVDVRALKNNEPKITWALGKADTDPKGHKDKRGWFIDLDEGERAWQRAFWGYGENGVKSISYVTTTYPDADGKDESIPSCKSETKAPFSWTIAFDPDDGSQRLAGSGTIDTNYDGQLTSGKSSGTDVLTGSGSDPSIVTTGLRSDDVLLSSADPVVVPPTPRGFNSPGGGLAGNRLSRCPGVMSITQNANNSGSSQGIACRPALPSSWQELK